ncbi:hypothetical protein SAMN02800692_1534 [Luteibacter sp. UNC138MFCol5.1]|uniref:hypothetical protein n=1 Tax=Luteibacter sp. UNC138MFCol5.1 TaxID=1502774 RepID=UPI0008C28B2A|nr:hypothetical protein [Luteibacter sp. UNC138MFCol5.1]SEO63748.1 hypothetical protein SAMN02800692_1534 [Luteibacter sp. UNC138MFCol5.1]
MTIHFATRAERILASVRGSLNVLVNEPYEPESLAVRCENLAGMLKRAAGDLRRTAKQQKKSGAAGAVHDTRK